MIVKCPRCGHATGNMVNEETSETIQCQYCGYPRPPEVADLRTQCAVGDVLTFGTARMQWRVTRVDEYAVEVEPLLEGVAP